MVKRYPRLARKQVTLAGVEAGSKLKKAETLGVKIISEDEFVIMVSGK